MASASDWATRVTEAETALHNLMMGARVVELFSPDGTKVRYQEADIGRLQTYIDYAKAQQSAASTSCRTVGPIYFTP